MAPTPSPAQSPSTNPRKAYDNSKDSDPSDPRGLSIYNALIKSRSLWVETKPLMIDQLLKPMDGNYLPLAEVSEMEDFINTEGPGGKNEKGFCDLVNAVTCHLDRSSAGSNIKYVQTGDSFIFPRLNGFPRDEHFGLKPDFFTSGTQPGPLTGSDVPLSISTILSQPVQALDATNPQNSRRSTRDIGYPSASIGSNAHVLKSGGLFCWEDVQVIWELESSPNKHNSEDVWGNLIVKATEVLRFQWHRQFVLGFLVCGTTMQMFYFNRSGVLVSLPVDFRSSMEGRLALVKCILAPIVLPHTAVGFTINPHNPRTIEVEGKAHLIIQVGGNNFVLGDQIALSRKDTLVTRGTTAHMARSMEDQEWNLCYKSSWPEGYRTHEGIILKNLKNVEGVVQVVAWDTLTLACDEVFTASHIHENFRLRYRTSYPSSTFEGQQQPKEVLFHPRQHRQTVTEYLPYCVADQQLSLTELLHVWRSLYLVVDAIAREGWVHRDLSWSNIRLVQSGTSWAVTLIGFDLAAPIIGPSTGSPDKTGTPVFMPMEILTSIAPCRHQELHEDESVFWVGFLALVNRSIAGKEAIDELHHPKLRKIAGIKLQMLLGVSKDQKWPTWFDRTDQMRVVQGVLDRVIQLQFTSGTWPGLDFWYPSVGKVDEKGIRTNWKRHKELLKNVVKVLETAIEQLGNIDEQEIPASV